jgi:S-DNA-T family DNA segregation ATPase FtsK/SpoIIIE
MSTTLHRGPATRAPELPQGRVLLEAPPELQPNEGAGGALMTALPMLGSVGSIVFVAATQPGPKGLISAGMFLVATLGFVVVQIDRQRKQRYAKVAGARREYLTYLAGVRRQARDAAGQQRAALLWHHPAPGALAALAEERGRVWEHQSTDPEFLHVRYGVCTQPLALDLVPPESAPIEQIDPVAASALHRLLVVHRVQQDLPAVADLRAFERIEITGDGDRARAMARAMICSATAFQSPEQLLVAVVASEATLADWEWVKWLPHSQSPFDSDAIGASRMVVTSVDDLTPMLPPDLMERPRFGAEEPSPMPHILLIVDGGDMRPGNHVAPPDGVHGITVLDLPTSWGELTEPYRLRFNIEPQNLRDGRVPVAALRAREEPVKAIADQLSVAGAEAFARRLAPLHEVQGPARNTGALERSVELLDLLGLGDVRDFDVDAAWRPRPARDRLRVPVGLGEGGGPVHLDIKESAQQGMGPHGLVVGATGSGKSEFLRTLVLGLAATHSPEVLNLVLVDFKGGATFAGMSEMPHVSAVITNLENELTLVDRMQDALSGEMVRRQELLREAGNFASLRDYEKARTSGQDLEPLPSLFIVVDEFSELLSAKPEFIDLFVAIGRLGRSLGLHLLLASQRLEEGRLRGLESHLSYRVGLRTFSASESRTVLGVPDAYELPPVPGLGYLKPDQSTLLKFKASYVSGPPPARRSTGRREGGKVMRGILPFSLGHVLAPIDREPEPEHALADAVETAETRSVIDIAVDRMLHHGAPAHQIWLPPLDVPDTLDELMPDLAVIPELGYVSRQARARGALTVAIGTVDRPREQRRDPFVVNLAGAGGHVAVVGGPRSGKSTLLRTLVTSISLGSTPLETQFYVLDFGGGTFAPLTRLPHVAGVATRSEPDVARRVVAEITGIVDRREAYFRAQGIDSVETYRARRREGRADDGYGDVFLVIDGWSTLRADFDQLEIDLQALAQRGLTFGLHLVTSTARWADFRSGVRDLFGTRMELALGDPMDSEIDRNVAKLIPRGRPGRGLTQSKLHFLAALPRCDGEADAATLGQGVDNLIDQVAKAWTGAEPPKLRLLPQEISLDDVRARAGASDRRVLLGVNERDLAPIGLDIDAEPHLLAFGDSGAGKSALLRGYIREVLRTRTPEQAKFVVVDYRRSLLGEVPDEYLLEYVTTAPQAEETLGQLAAFVKDRLPGSDVTPQQLRDRSWWTGADVFVVFDDYDLVASQSSAPASPLVPMLAQARDVGLHVAVARRSGGASRTLYEPVIQSLRDLAMPGVLLAGSPDEGPLIGNTRPAPGVPGRGRLITRDRGVEVIQTAWTEPAL